MSYALLIILLAGLSFLIWNASDKIGLSKKSLMIGWGIKLLFAGLFLLIFTHYYSNGSLYGDVANFMYDSSVLADYGRSDPGGYFNLLMGMNSDDLSLMQNELSETKIWSYGDNGDFINDNRLIIRINSVIHFFSFGNILVHSLIFAFISFIGTIFIYKTFSKLVNNQHFLFFGLLLFPTIGFWGSGISKECLMIFAFGIFCWGLSKLLQKRNDKWSRLTFIVGLAMLLFNKPHMGICLLVFLPFFIWFYKSGINKKKLAISLGILTIIGVALSYSPPKTNPVDKISNKLQDFKNIGTGGVFFITDSSFCAFDYATFDHFSYNSEHSLIQVNKPTTGEYKLFGKDEFYPFTIPKSEKQYDVYLIQPPSNSIVEVPSIKGSGVQLIKNIPLAIMNTTLRPFPTDQGGPLKYVLLLENLIFLVLALFVLRNHEEKDNCTRSWVFLLILAGFSLIVLIGLTTPVLGAVARYKSASFLLFFIALSLIIKPISILKK